ncbi:MAG: hypothetical protein ABIL18_05595, partial [candidate division WOR-3 bacterium]
MGLGLEMETVCIYLFGLQNNVGQGFSLATKISKPKGLPYNVINHKTIYPPNYPTIKPSNN